MPVDISYILARVLGVTLLVLYGGLILNQKLFRSFADSVLSHPVLLFITGFIGVVLGLLMIQVHNIWVLDWRVIITFFAWWLFLSGALRVLFPEFIMNTFHSFFKASPDLIYFIGAIFCLVGAFLTYMGLTPYFHGM